MRKLVVAGGIIVAIIIIGMVGLRFYTKSFSPLDKAIFEGENTELVVTYSRPYKKGRKIFGDLVPYDKVWRTGANEATIFTTDKDLMIGNKLLKAGSYSLFTIPRNNSWTIIFNKEVGQWGIVPFSGESNRDPEQDALTVDVATIKTPDLFEQFTIAFEQMGHEIEMILMWDHTLIVVPMYVASN
ncbi:DUF2911 domain-containing protein [Fulvivirga sp. 29W222]|uniref:DUF2911 domain-containing protein n=1 Tax=Fulvivirga marina TaxID=2494733 RepID=A0A937KB14_9BACT|nr:DUF2911 domain-containing protein [Fulvivirga marina]MBL6446281.1 DUF2911 domain-containing protein [Fulvivirga marina]